MKGINGWLVALILSAGIAVLYAPSAGASRVVARQQGTVTALDAGSGWIHVNGHRYRLAPGAKVHGRATSGAALSPATLRPGMDIGFEATGGRHPMIHEIWIRARHPDGSREPVR